MMTKQPNNQAGFTLIEAFVAISILLLSVVGPISLVARSIADANYAANQITAFYLAQEGLELVINQRERNEPLGKNAWLDGLNNCTNGQTCQVYLDETGLLITESCQASTGCNHFYLDSENDSYVYEEVGNTGTSFVREIKISLPTTVEISYGGGEIDNTTVSAKVESTIRWSDKGREHAFTLSTLLTD